MRLPVKLTQAEILDRASTLAREMRDRRVAAEAADSARKKAKDDLERRDLRIEELSRVVGDGSEDREVDTHEEPDTVRLVVRVIRDDTYELVHERSMTDAEVRAARQEALPFVGPKGRRKKGEVEP